MPEPNATALSVSEIKKLEAKLTQTRDATKVAILEAVNAELAQLAEIGFEYKLVEEGSEPRKLKCSICSGAHTARTCPNKK